MPLTEKEIRERTTPPNLKPKEKHFLSVYLDESNPNYTNGVQAVKDAYGYTNYGTAAVKASRLLKRDNIQLAAEALMEKYGAGEDVRFSRMAEIINGKYTSHQTITHKTADGEPKSSTEYTRSPTPKEVLTAIDVVNKTQGVYETNRLKREVLSEELRGLFRKFAPQPPGKSKGKGKA